MRRFWISLSLTLSAALLLAVAATARADDDNRPGSSAFAFQAVMTGQSEVPPTTGGGEGLASFLLSRDNSTLYYTVQVTGASSTVAAAHIHLGRRGQNGDVVVNLCGAGSAPACASEGIIATGSITAANLVGPLAGHPLSDLISAMRSGNAYANVHTANFPMGEMRGQTVSVGGGGMQREREGDQNEDHNNQGNGDDGGD